MSGKGDTQRPSQVPADHVAREWDRIFGPRSLRQTIAEGQRMWNERIPEWDALPHDPIPGPGGVVGTGRRRGERTGAHDRKPPERRKAAR